MARGAPVQPPLARDPGFHPPGIIFGSARHFPDPLEVGTVRHHFALRGDELQRERQRLMYRAVAMPPFEPATGWDHNGALGPINPSRREAVSLVAFWRQPDRVDPGVSFPVRLSDPERYLCGPSLVYGPGGPRRPTLSEAQIVALMFEGSSEMRPPGGMDTSLTRLQIDERDMLAGSRLQDAARIFCLFCDAHGGQASRRNQMWFIPLRAMLARMVIGLNFELNILRRDTFAGSWGHLAWLPDNGGIRLRRQEDRAAEIRRHLTAAPAPFIFEPPAFVMPAVDAAGAAGAPQP